MNIDTDVKNLVRNELKNLQASIETEIFQCSNSAEDLLLDTDNPQSALLALEERGAIKAYHKVIDLIRNRLSLTQEQEEKFMAELEYLRKVEDRMNSKFDAIDLEIAQTPKLYEKKEFKVKPRYVPVGYNVSWDELMTRLLKIANEVEMFVFI